MDSYPILTYDRFLYHHSRDNKLENMQIARHWHKMNELYFFISGDGTFLVENTVYKLQPGDLILLRAGERHQFIPTTPVSYERCCLHFDSSLMVDYSRLLSPFLNREAGVHNLLRPDQELFMDLFHRVEQAAALPDEEARRTLSVFLLGEILTYVSVYADNSVRLIGGAPMPPLVETLLQYIHEHLCEPLNLDVLAEQVFMTKPHIGRVFKAAMGIAPMEYITGKRIQLAQQLLQQGVGAEDTAARCGFGDYSSFYRAYRRIMGRSPRRAEEEMGHERDAGSGSGSV